MPFVACDVRKAPVVVVKGQIQGVGLAQRLKSLLCTAVHFCASVRT